VTESAPCARHAPAQTRCNSRESFSLWRLPPRPSRSHRLSLTSTAAQDAQALLKEAFLTLYKPTGREQHRTLPFLEVALALGGQLLELGVTPALSRGSCNRGFLLSFACILPPPL